MNRTIKNIIMGILIVILSVGMVFTLNGIKNGNSTSNTQDNTMMNGKQGGRQNDGNTNGKAGMIMDGDSQNSGHSMKRNQKGNEQTMDNQTPPEMPNGMEDGSTPPDMPNGDDGERPEMPDMQNNENGETPPEMPQGESGEMPQMGNGAPGEMNFDNQGGRPSDNNQNSSATDTNDNTIKASTYVIIISFGLVISALVIYLLLSEFNKKSFKETFNSKEKIIIGILGLLLLTGLITACDVYVYNNMTSKDEVKDTNSNNNNDNKSLDSKNMSSNAVGVKEVSSGSETLEDTYESTASDQSVILVKDGASATIDGANINKKSGDSSDTESSEFYGVNAAILVTEKSSATIKNASISTSAKGANAVFATGTDSKIYISDSKIISTGSSSARGLDATYGGYIEADNVTISTQGGSCASLATDRGEGTVIAKNSSLETNGSGSPVIYSTGDISIENTKGTANGSQMIVIEGKNSATVTSSTLSASGAGNRGDVDQAGVMIYQSMSGDAGTGTGTLTAKDSSLTINSSSKYYKTAPMFFITNTDAVINLTNTKLSYGSGILISTKGTSEWGKSGSNGGNVTLNATNQTLTGNIEVDSISTASINLIKSTYKGTINGDNTAKSVELVLDANSKITLTGDSYVTTLTNANTKNTNISFNGYKLYVNGVAIN